MTNEIRPRLRELLPCEAEDLNGLTRELLEVRTEMLELESRYKGFDKVHPRHYNSARNLVQYLAFRKQDVRGLQVALTEWGLSSLGRAERKVQATLDTLLHVMHQMLGREWKPQELPPSCFREGQRLLDKNTEILLGDYPSGRRVRIMVTMPTEAASDYRLVYELLKGGMNCARINCAHDTPEVWERMVANICKAEDASGIPCKILMDLAGPKLRTGPLPPRPSVVKVRPKRNDLGQVLRPARIWLCAGERDEKAKAADGVLQVPAQWLGQLKKGDQILLKDARKSNRKLTVESVGEDGAWLSADKTVYFAQGTVLRLQTKSRKIKSKTLRLACDMPRKEPFIRLFKDEILVLTENGKPGSEARRNKRGKAIVPAVIGCTIPEILNDVQTGEPIWFDDGKIGGVIEKIEPGQVEVRITHARPKGERLRSEKGINLPDSELRLQALTEEDLQSLEFAVRHADMVGLSFANTTADVDELIAQLKRLKPENPPGIILKVETRRGFDNLPAMILSAMQTEICGVMIARGDLAIECGFGRLAEVQEQILWICEAAHLPVVWATQVLEGLAKQGLPTRAEVTDAAMGQRAECIMLNKGEHIVEATIALDDILRRMQDHQTKKRSLLRKLQLAEKFFANA